MYFRFKAVTSRFRLLKILVLTSNILCIVITIGYTIISMRDFVDFNDNYLILRIFLFSTISLFLIHYVIILLFRIQLKYQNEIKAFELFLEQNKIKTPYFSWHLLSFVTTFFISMFFVLKPIQKEIDKNSIEICCGKVNAISQTIKRSNVYADYYFEYQSKTYRGVLPLQNSNTKGNYHHSGVPIFIGDEYYIKLHKNKPWHNELVVTHPSKKQIEKFKSHIRYGNGFFDLGPLLDSIESKFGFSGLLAYYNSSPEQLKYLDKELHDTVIKVQSNETFKKMIFLYHKAQGDSILSRIKNDSHGRY